MNKKISSFYSRALKKLVDAKTGRIAAMYKSDLNHAWYLVGDIKYRQSKFVEAISAFKKSLSHEPDDWQALMALGNCHDRLGKPRASLAYLNRALKINPRSSEVRYNLANAFFDLGKYRDAIKYYEKVRTRSRVLQRAVTKNKKIALSRLTH